MASSSIIEVDDPCYNHFSDFFSSAKVVTREHLVLQCREERLRGRIIKARSDPAHGLCDVELLAQGGEVVRGVGRATILWKITPATVPPRVAPAIVMA